jgi:hypothetical protein
MLGYCGINCGECAAYKGTVNTDAALLEKAAGSYWNGAYGVQEWVCLGCTPADQGFLAKYCATCKIRGCAIEKQVQNCAACADYETCQQLEDFVRGESEALAQRLNWLRARFKALGSDAVVGTPGGAA